MLVGNEFTLNLIKEYDEEDPLINLYPHTIRLIVMATSIITYNKLIINYIRQEEGCIFY